MKIQMCITVMLRLIFICVCIKTVTTKLHSLINESWDILNYYSKISSILKKDCSTTVVFIEENFHCNEISNKIIQLLSPCPLIIMNRKKSYASKRSKHVFVLINSEEIENWLKHSNESFNVRAYFYFIICQPIEDVSWIKQTMMEIWKNKILHFMISFSHQKILETFTYNPFFDKITNLSTFNKQLIYENKLQNMNGYRLHVGFFSDPPRIIEKNGIFYGIDAMIMMEFGRKLNATIEIIKPGTAKIVDEKFMKHAFQVRRRKSDFGFVSCFAIQESQSTVVYTYPRRMDGIVVLVPHSSIIPQFYYMFMMFEELIWIFLCVSLFAVTICEYFHLKYKFIPTDFCKILTQNWGVMLSLPFPTVQEFLSIRILLLFWINGCVILSLHFQSFLTSELVTSKFERNIDTLNELKKNSTVIVINQSNFRGIMGQYPRNLIRTRTEYKIMENITKGDTTAAYAIQSSVAELVSMKKTEDGYPVYHIMKELLVPGYTAYLFPADSPYLDAVNK